MGEQNGARRPHPLFRSTAAPQRDPTAPANPEMQTSEAVVASSKPRRRPAAPEASRGLPPSDSQEIIGWSRRNSLAMGSPCGASDEGISFSWHAAAQGIKTPWSQMRPRSPGATSEVEAPPITPPQAAQFRRLPDAASAPPPAATYRTIAAVSPDTVLGLDEGGSQWREWGSDSNALLSPDSVFEMDMQRGWEIAAGEGALPWAPTAHTAVRLKTALGGSAY